MFHKQLKEIRESKGLTQTELAERVGITPPAISLLEAGKKQPSFDTLKHLAIELDVSLDYLVYGGKQ